MAAENNNKTLNVPTLRFPEFSGEWERMRASELLGFFSTNSLSWEQLEYGGQDKLNLHYGLIHNGLPTLINAAKEELPAVKPEFSPKKYTLCKEGDVAFADASEDTNDVGKVVEFINCDGKDIVCGLHTIHGRDKEDKTVMGFKGYVFSSPAFHNQIRRIAQGTKIYSINTSNFDEVDVCLPSKAEQHKIVVLLSKLDERIAIQNKIIEKYKSLIKAIAKRLFIEDYPVIRLGDIADIYQPKTISSDHLSSDADKGCYPVYGANGIIGYYSKYNHEKPQICIACRGSSCGAINYTKPRSWITGNAMVINTERFADRINQRFLYHYLSIKDFTSIISGSGQPQIVRTPVQAFPIPLPTPLVQTRIASILDGLKDDVTLDIQQLKLYSKQKLYFLTHLFI